MKVKNLVEEIKNGNYYNINRMALETDEELTQDDVDWILSTSPYYNTKAFSSVSIKIHDELLATGRSEFGWATYYIEEVEDD